MSITVVHRLASTHAQRIAKSRRAAAYLLHVAGPAPRCKPAVAGDGGGRSKPEAQGLKRAPGDGCGRAQLLPEALRHDSMVACVRAPEVQGAGGVQGRGDGGTAGWQPERGRTRHLQALHLVMLI